MPIVSVIICTYNRRNYLEDCLNSLLNINYPESGFEVLIIDGGSTDGTKELVKESFPKVKFILERQKGLSNARNTGVKQAKGSIIAFIDDDCIVDKDWLRSLVYSYLGNDVGGVGGKALPLLEVEPPSQYKGYLELLGVHDKGDERKEVDWIVGCNMSFRKKIFEEVGLFNPLLGRKGTHLTSNEELEFCWRVKSHGYRVMYEPEAIVHHKISAQRLRPTYIGKRSFYQGVSDYHTPHLKRRPLSKIFREILINGLRLFRWQRLSYLIEICYYTGFLREILLDLCRT